MLKIFIISPFIEKKKICPPPIQNMVWCLGFVLFLRINKTNILKFLFKLLHLTERSLFFFLIDDLWSLYERKSSTVWIWAQINIVSLLWGTQLGCGPWAEYFYKPGRKQAGDMECFLLWRMSFTQAQRHAAPSKTESQRVYLYSSDSASPIFSRGPDTVCSHLAFLINRSMPFSNFFLLKYFLKTKHLKRNTVFPKY